MDMDVRTAVRLGDLIVIDLGKPVVGCHRAGVAEDQTTNGISHGGVLLHTPVLNLHVTVYHILVIQDGVLHVTDFFSLFSI